MWRGGTQVDFCSFVWRRGTVPLWWQTQIKNKVGEVEISIREKDTYEYSDKYYAGLLERYVLLFTARTRDMDRMRVSPADRSEPHIARADSAHILSLSSTS